jgi:glyceraldehyde-3-phosphate dehydrogenase (NAD(P))
MNESKTVLVIGTGTIGEPLIGLLARLRNDLKIDRVLFHKRTPLDYEISKVDSLVNQGAELVVNEDCWQDFLNFGHKPIANLEKALEISDVVIDCTPAGNCNKDQFFLPLTSIEESKTRLFIAQGSEKGFGIPYAFGINDEILDSKDRIRFLQVVSCNTHAMSRLVKSLNPSLDENLISSDFVCIRRANDASQDSGFVPSPTVGKHTDDMFGTHHARDVSDLLQTISNKRFNFFSSAIKTNSQYMHLVRFSISLKEALSLEEVKNRFAEDKFVAMTEKKSANRIFSFGRDHGFYGRIYNQVVISAPTLITFPTSENSTVVTGFAFTPQDGNSLLSSVAACLYGIHGADYKQYLSPLLRYLRDDI